MSVSLIIAAGGSGKRFRKSVSEKGRDLSRKRSSKDISDSTAKLLQPLSGEPLIVRTIDAFQKIPEIQETIVAASADLERALRRLVCRKRWKEVRVVRGGETRAQSVLKALCKTHRKYGWVMVHDGARPFVDQSIVRKLLAATEGVDGVILGKRVVPTIKEIDHSMVVKKTIDRRILCEAETPQLVRRSTLQKAYQTVSDASESTDEAALLEKIGASVRVVTHDGWNPKITTVQDYALVNAYMNQKKEKSVRTGYGCDTHRLVPKRKLYLGGVLIPYKLGALGHSDGDALIHAIGDAILGCVGKGDIGEWFSDKDPRYKGIRSEKLLKKILSYMSESEWAIQNVDTVVELEKPKLSPYKKRIRKNLSRMMNLPADAVSVKAKTMEGLGPVGEGSAVMCHAIVTMEKKS